MKWPSCMCGAVLSMALCLVAPAGCLAQAHLKTMPTLADAPRDTPGLVCNVSNFLSALPVEAVIESVYSVKKGGSAGEGPPANIAYPRNPTNLPEMCVVTVNVTSSPQSNYRFGLFLPTDWNGRFLTVGNGALAGGINWLDMGAGSQYGFAVASTDSGHNGSQIDASWALNNTGRQEDFGYRSIHGSSTIGQRLVRQYYGSSASHSYYSGCSTGGRQGLKETSMYQTTFDGVLIGAPAWWNAHMLSWIVKTGIYNLPVDGPNHVPPAMFPVLGAEVVRQCDSADGVTDGIVSTPDQCDFSFAPLKCGEPGVNASSCLTDAQVQTVVKIRSDYISNDGRFVFPGLEKSSEFQWSYTDGGSTPNSLGTDYFKTFLGNSSWQWTDYDDHLVWLADARDPGNLTPGSDLTGFRAKGGKLLMYHGLADGDIPPNSSLIYRQKVADDMAGGNKTALDDWYRLFLVPGMAHCGDSSVDAPWYIAGPNHARRLGTSTYSVPGFEDAEHDALLALVRWVEKGQAPDAIVATAWKNQSDASSGVLRQRPLCPYPQTAKLEPSKDEQLATSWKCS